MREGKYKTCDGGRDKRDGRLRIRIKESLVKFLSWLVQRGDEYGTL